MSRSGIRRRVQLPDDASPFDDEVLQILRKHRFSEFSRIGSETDVGLAVLFSNGRFVIRLVYDYHGTSMDAAKVRSDKFYVMQTVLNYLLGADREGPAPLLEVAHRFDAAYERVARMFGRFRFRELAGLREYIAATNKKWYERNRPPNNC